MIETLIDSNNDPSFLDVFMAKMFGAMFHVSKPIKQWPNVFDQKKAMNSCVT